MDITLTTSSKGYCVRNTAEQFHILQLKFRYCNNQKLKNTTSNKSVLETVQMVG